MSGAPVRGILDTSAVIGLSRMVDAGMLPAEPMITAVTLAELSVGPLVARDEQERAARQAHLQQAEAEAANPRVFVSATVPANHVQILAKTPETVVAAIEAVVHHSR